MGTFFVILLISIFAVLAIHVFKRINEYNEDVIQSTEEKLTYLAHKLYNDHLSLNEDALDAYKALIRESFYASQGNNKTSSANKTKNRTSQ